MQVASNTPDDGDEASNPCNARDPIAVPGVDIDEVDIEANAAANPITKRKRNRKWGLESLFRQQAKARTLRLLVNAMHALQACRPSVDRKRGHPTTSCDEIAMLFAYMQLQGMCVTSSRSDFQNLVDAGIIAAAPHPNTLVNWRSFQGKQARGPALLGALDALFRLTLLPARHSIRHVIVDSTGLSINGNANWIDCEKGKANMRRGTEWAKLHLTACKVTKLVAAFRLTECSGKGTGDPSNLIPMLKDTLPRIARLRSVSADKIYCVDEIFDFIIKKKADPIIPMKSNFKAKTKIHTDVAYAKWLQDRYELRRAEFDILFGPRSIIESTIKSIKGKDDARLWTVNAEQRLIEVYSKLIIHNFRRLVWFEMVNVLPPIEFGDYEDEIRRILAEQAERAAAERAA